MSKDLVVSQKTTTCRKCKESIPVDSRYCPKCGIPRKSDAGLVVLVVLLLGSSFLLMSSSYVTNKQITAAQEGSTTTLTPAQPIVSVPQPPPPPKDMSASAYQAAKRFTQERFPDAKRVSEMNESPVAKNGDIFQVSMFADSVDNGSIKRTTLQVKLTYDRGKWQLKEIAQ